MQLKGEKQWLNHLYLLVYDNKMAENELQTDLDYIKDGHTKEEVKKEGKMAVGEEVITCVDQNETEAVPYYDYNYQESANGDIHSLDMRTLNTIIDERVCTNDSILALKQDMHRNRVLLHDLKTSVLSLNISTSKIEHQVSDLASTYNAFSGERKTLEASLVDLEFRFNELVTHQEEDCDVNNNDVTNYNDVTEESAEQVMIRGVITNLESKIRQLDDRIASIDEQNVRISALADDIKENENVVYGLREMIEHNSLDQPQTFLTEDEMKTLENNIEENEKTIDDMQNILEASKRTDTCLLGDPPPSREVWEQQLNEVWERRVQEIMQRAQNNTKQIESAWVGLIAALLLIPIAFLLGKFL